jgi:SET domain-containing protein
MLVVKTFLKYSSIHGLGCFAGEDIKKGQLVWRFDSGIDLTFGPDELKNLPMPFQEFLKIYAYSPAREPKSFILCVDHARHMNHSEKPSLLETIEGHNIAARDISCGEELTCNYHDFDSDAETKLLKNRIDFDGP